MIKEGIMLVCFDLNKTLIKENSWLNLNLAMGITQEEDDLLMRWYEEGVLSYEETNQILLSMYKKRGKANRANILEAISTYTYMPGALDLVKNLQEKGYEIALITGAMDILADKVASELGITMSSANNIFIFDEDDYLQDLVMFGDDGIAKRTHLEEFATKLGINLDQCACIGDGDNDRELFEATGRGITFEGSKISDVAWNIVRDLSEIQLIL